MGDVVKRRRGDAWQRLIASLAVLAVAAGGGCTSAKPTKARVVEATPPAAAAPAEAKVSAAAAAEIRTLDLREGAPGVDVDIEASAPLVWTSFRNADGKVVIELPNALPRAGLSDLTPEDGLVSSLKVESSSDGSRPMTRLVISTRQEAEHSVTAEGNHLRVQLQPVEMPAARGAGKMAFEPVPADKDKDGKDGRDSRDKTSAAPATPPAPAPTPAPTPVPSVPAPSAAGLGTPDRPVVAPAPTGTAATRLDAVEVLASEGGAVVRISGDGEFPYATFALDEPERFVIDLDGVINRSPKAAVAVNGGIVERIRVAQFKPYPKAVSRVVFDLKGKVVPVIERTADALVVTFPSGSGAAVAAPARMTAGEPAAAPQNKAAKPPRKSARAARKSEPAASETVASPPPASTAAASDLALAPRQTQAPSQAPAQAPTQTPTPTQNPTATATLASKGPSAIESEEASPSPQTSQTPPPAAKPAAGRSVGAQSKTAAAGKPAVTLKPAGGVAPAPPSPLDSFQSKGVGAGGERVYSGEPVDLKVTNADVTDVLRTFAQISGLNMVVQPGVSGQVTAEMDNVPWDQALEEVLKINNLSYELEGNVMRIAPVSVLRQEATEKQQLAQAQALSIPLQTVFRRLSYANADAIASLLKAGTTGLLSQRGSVIVDSRTNSLIIKELPAFMDTVISVIDRLDAPEPQVMIEARIIETTKQFSRDLGIQWGFTGVSDAAHGNTTGLVFPNHGTAAGNVNLLQGGNNGALNLHLGNVLNTFNLDIALQAAENEGLVHVLSAPKVATLNNQQASIQSGLQIPVQTVANNTVTVQYVNATLRLDVTPQVTAEGTVMMTVSISKREPQTAFLVPGATNTPIATKEASTKLLVRDGGTAVIGGIYKVTTNESEGRVPGLANIPLIGHLFKNRSRSEQNDELLIFITPRVIKL